MKKLFNFLARRKSPEAGGVTLPAEFDVEAWVRELDEKARDAQKAKELKNTWKTGSELLEVHTGDPDQDRLRRQAQFTITDMSEHEQIDLIQKCFVLKGHKNSVRYYAGKTFATLSAGNQREFIRFMAERLKQQEEAERAQARTQVWLAARK